MKSTTTAIVLAGALAAAAAASADEPKGPEVIELKAHPFDLKQVRLLDGPFKDAMERDRAYLHAMDPNRLLHTWRLNAGLPSSARPLGGWEKPDCEVRGHTMGHYLSACALMHAATGDEKLKAKAEALVAELARCQKALGESGYLSAFPESFFDRVEARKPVWAPYYTLHKLYAGLLDVHEHCGNAQALEVARRMAEWNKRRLDRLDGPQMQAILNRTEQGGMNEALANLAAATGERQWLDLARRFDQDRYTEPLARGEDRLKGEHVNSFIPNIIGTARQYELAGDARDRRIAEFFWHQVTTARCYVTGGTSHNEHWRSDPNRLADQLGDCTQETCCTYNMLKLTRRLFGWNAQARYADYYERALWNGILATQHPTTGMMMYFVPLGPGRWKMFNTPDTAFWCCTGTGLENHARYGEAIYFHDGEGVFVNLFIASEVMWPGKGVRIRQETRFPEQEGTALTVLADKPVDMMIRIRVPWWARSGVTVKLNGRTIPCDPRPGHYFPLRRQWADGDRLELALPMHLYAETMPDDKTLVAYLYGPLVLAGQLGGEGLTDENTHTPQNWYRFANPAEAPTLLVEGDDPTACLRPVEGQKLTWRTAGQEREVTLIPYWRLFGQRYVVYWRAYRKGSDEHRRALAEESARQEARQRQLARQVDAVEIADAESEKAHGLTGERTGTGAHMSRPWRHALNGGWFSYDLKVLPDRPVALSCTWWGGEGGNRVFDILVDGTRIATQKLLNNKPGEFFDTEYPIPADLTKGKHTATVRFQAREGAIAGGIFGCAVLRPAEEADGRGSEVSK